MNRLLPFVVPVFVLLAGGLAAKQDPERPAPQVRLRVPLDEDPARELQVYDIGDVVDAVLDVQDGVELLEPKDRITRARSTARALRDAIAAFVEPRLEEGDEVQSLGGEHLAVVARAEQHAWIGGFLGRQRSQGGTIAMIDVEILQMTPAAFASLEIGREPLVLDAGRARQLRGRLMGKDGAPTEGIDMLQAPRLAMLALQQAQVSAVEQVAYVRDYKVHTLDDGSKFADPWVDTIEAGLSLDGSFVVVGPESIGLSWHVHLADLARPIPNFETSLLTGQAVTIQLPNVAIADFEAKVVLRPGSLAVFPGPQVRGKRVIVLMQVAKLEAPGDKR